MVTSQIEQQILVRLSASEVRYTKGRRWVIKALTTADGPRSASDLYGDLNHAVPISSIYRSLAVMTEAGVLVPHHGTGGVTRYELAEWLMGHHHHLVCNSCGAIDDIELPEESENALDVLVTEASKTLNFVATDHSLEIGGLCASCS